MFCVIRHPLIIAPGGAQRQGPLTERLRLAEEIGKLFDMADILVLSLGAEPADRHVLDPVAGVTD